MQATDGTPPDLLPLPYRILISAASPTWLLADCLKRGNSGAARTKLIRHLNTFWLIVSVLSFFFLGLSTLNSVERLQAPPGWLWDHPLSFTWRIPFGYLLWSRCTEISFAFLRDAYDKTGEPVTRSDLRPKDRLVLAFKSYIELICNFAILFALCPADAWQKTPKMPGKVTDMLYFSATTITTSGNGAMIPSRWQLQLLSTYEIYCGLILLVVCFTIYTGLGKGKRSPATPSGTSGPAQPRRRY